MKLKSPNLLRKLKLNQSQILSQKSLRRSLSLNLSPRRNPKKNLLKSQQRNLQKKTFPIAQLNQQSPLFLIANQLLLPLLHQLPLLKLLQHLLLLLHLRHLPHHPRLPYLPVHRSLIARLLSLTGSAR